MHPYGRHPDGLPEVPRAGYTAGHGSSRHAAPPRRSASHTGQWQTTGSGHATASWQTTRPRHATGSRHTTGSRQTAASRQTGGSRHTTGSRHTASRGPARPPARATHRSRRIIGLTLRRAGGYAALAAGFGLLIMVATAIFPASAEPQPPGSTLSFLTGDHSGHEEPALAAAGSPVPTGSRAGLPEGWTVTASGPLSPSDRELLVRVRLAGLWEAPVGRQAEDRASSERVKEAGHHLVTDHLALDEKVQLVAAELGVDLPSQPNEEQLGWMAELSGKSGTDFDTTFANRLRVAHGEVFSLAATVRASTRNEVIRSFAQTAVNVVQKHMAMLESTGLVDYGDLPTTAAAIVPAAANLTPRGGGGTLSPALIWAIIGVALFAGVIATTRVTRRR